MTTKKSITAIEPAAEADNEAVEIESMPAPDEEPAEIQKTKPAEEDGFSVYLGPSIRGVIQSGAVYGMPKDQAVASLSAAVEKYPQIAILIVPGGSLPEDRIKVKTPGNLLSVSYSKLVALANTK